MEAPPEGYHPVMTLRRLVYRWLIPACFILPLLLVGSWAIFDADKSLWGLLPAAAVLVLQVAATILVRSRPSVRASGAVSTVDAYAFAGWHVLIVLGGLLPASVSARLVDAATVVGVALLVLTILELAREGGRGRVVVPDPSAEAVRKHAEAARDATKNDSIAGWRGGTGSTW